MSDILDEIARLPPPAAPPLSAALEGELRSLRPVHARRPMRQLAWLLGAAIAYASLLLFGVHTRPDMCELPLAWMIGAATMWLLGFVVPSFLALVPARGSVMPRWRLAAGAALVSAVGFVLFGLAIHPGGPSSVTYGVERFWDGHVCLELGVATAVLPVIVGALCVRGAVPVGDRWIAAALGAGGGSLGGLVLHLHCHVVDALHVGLIHGGVVVVSAGLSAAVVPRNVQSTP